MLIGQILFVGSRKKIHCYDKKASLLVQHSNIAQTLEKTNFCSLYEISLKFFPDTIPQN